jgi:uncharacterized membrane protein YccC
MVGTGQICALVAALWLDLPPLPTLISATILAITTTDPLAMEQKAYQRGLGAVLGGGYAVASLILLAYMPYFTLLLALVFIGMFLSAYYTKMSSRSSYAFMQMGLAMPLALIGSSGDIGSIDTALQRLVGVGAGFFIAEVVFVCWPWSLVPGPTLAATAPVPRQEPSAEIVKPGG